MFKKASNILIKTIIGLALSLSPFLYLNAVSPFISSSGLSINNDSSSSIYLKPWDTLSALFFWNNSYGEDLNNLWMKLSFWNNAWFSYSWDDLFLFVENLNTISKWQYSTSTWIDFSTTETIANWWSVWINSNWNSFSINSDISTYENNLTLSFYWNRASDWSLISWDDFSKTIFVDVKPHIVDKYLEKSWAKVTSVKWNWQETFDLIVEVEDLNSCSNVDWWSVTADLSDFWLWVETLNFDSCKSTNIAKFKKTGITTNQTLWSKNIAYTNFSATDEDWNSHNPEDTNFVRWTEKNSLDYSVIAPWAPWIYWVTTPEWTIVWKATWKNVDINFNVDQNSSIKIALESCSQADSNKIFYENASFVANSWWVATIEANKLNAWDNTIYICADNWLWEVWNSTLTITEDSIAPLVNIISNSVSVIENDVDINFSCSENWNYYVETFNSNWTVRVIDSTAIVWWENTNIKVSNSSLVIWWNDIFVFCEDSVWNKSSEKRNVEKIEPTPSMLTSNLTVVDNDIDYEWVSWRDFSISWDTTIWENFDWFFSYNIYVLPKWAILGSWIQSYVWGSNDPSVWSLELNPLLVEDSFWDPLVWWADYMVYILIVWTSGQFWAPWYVEFTPIWDSIVKPIPLSAKFISNTSLEITTNTTLNTDLSSYDASKVVYKVNWIFFSPTAISWVDWTKINYTIPSLENPSAVWTDLDIWAFWLRSSIWGFNDDFTGKLNIIDWQKPTISALINNTSAISWNFYPSIINLSWNQNEAINNGDLSINFNRISWNSSINKSIRLWASYLTSWNKNINLELNNEADELSPKLVCWAVYNVNITWLDLAWNSWVSNTISNISFDDCNPNKTILNDIDLVWDTSVDLTWTATSDDSANSSWVEKYSIEFYSAPSCSGTPEVIEDITTTSYSKAVSYWNYSWRVRAIDRAWNIWEFSDCDDFGVDPNIPTFSNITLTDTTFSSSSYTDNWNSLELKANISNTDINNIFADLSLLVWDASYDNVSCQAPLSWVTCNFVWDLVTYSFNTWSVSPLTFWAKQAKIKARNTTWLNLREESKAITADVSAPQVLSDTITYPNWGEIVWGESIRITWDTAKISDDIWIEKIEITTVVLGVEWDVICSWVNSWFCDLTFTQDFLENVKIRLTAIDNTWKENFDESDSVFTIDRRKPVVWTDTLTFPNWGEILAGGESVDITWDNSKVSDETALEANPVSIYISENNWSSYTLIASNLANSWTYTTNLPDTNTDNALIKIEFKDVAWNIWEDISDNSFKIDNINPTLSITYAWAWWTTPQNWRSLNGTGMDLSLTSWDNNLDKIYLVFKNTTNNTFWDNTNWVYSASLVENDICVDSLALWNDGSCNNVNLSFNPTIEDLSSYEMLVYALDEAWNLTTSLTNSYSGDKQNPTLNINALPEFFSGNIDISWTSSDIWWISAVNLKIKKWDDYWDWGNFIPWEVSLVAVTTDSYNNWTYNFNPPVEADWSVYEIEVIALDRAYKDNNKTSSVVSIKSDNSWPDISSWFSINPTSGQILSWGESLNITWDNTKVSDLFSWVDNSSLEISYFDWNVYQIISSNVDLSSNSLSWSVPSIDVENSRLRFRIMDNVWNYSANFDWSSFSIDSTNPSVSSLETLENWISNWNINALRFKLSESILDSSINISDFSVDSWAISITWFSTWALANDDEIIIEFSEVSWTGATPTLSYSWTSVEDLAWRKLWSFSNIDSIDKATPRVLSREAFDSDENWKIDKIEITFSENLNSITSTNWLTLSGLSSWYSLNSASSNLNKITLSINEWSSFLTDSSLILVSISWWNYSDSSWNNIESFWLENVSDKAKPIFISARTVDWDSNNKVDEIRLSFSENMSNAILNDFALSNYSTWMTFDSVSIENSEVIFNLWETSLDNDTDNAILVNYTPWTLWDLNWNLTNQITNELALDTLPPIIEKIETRDLNKNWFIDAIYVEVNENLNDDFSLVNFWVNSYNISSLDSWNTANDNNFIINIDELSFKDTWATPLVRLSSNSSLWDEHWNDIASFITWQNALDKVWPVIKSARYEENWPWVSDDKLYITFSEDILAWSIDTNVWWFVNDFSISNFWAIWNTAITTVTSPTTVEVVLWANSSPLSPWVTWIYGKVWAIVDSNWNQSNSDFNLTNIIVSSSVIINEVMFASDRNNQYIELRNLSNSTANLSWITIKNVWGNGVDYTFSSWTISPNWYYLVAWNNKENSIINVDPDLVLPSLNLNSVSQNNIELEQWWTIIDSAKASPYPAWNSTLWYSMERKENITEWSLASSWYTAQASSNLDSDSYKWTPKLANIFDWVSPVISSYSPSDNDLLHIAPKIVFNYSDDNIWIDTTSPTFTIRKWNSGSFSSDLSWTLLESSIVENSKSTYQISNSALAWRYRAEFQISDLAWNTVSQNIEFFIDRFTSSITNSSINIWDIMPWAWETSLQEVTLTINTIWSWFKITQDKINQLSSWISTIWNYNWDTWFWYQIEKNRKWTIIPYSLINNISWEVENIEKLSTPNSQIETYIYKIRYYVKPELMQSAWVYSSDINIKVLPVY